MTKSRKLSGKKAAAQPDTDSLSPKDRAIRVSMHAIKVAAWPYVSYI